jgi:uncharacterized protein (DUF1810 family)/serine/threonine protein phosphatase PrpC
MPDKFNLERFIIAQQGSFDAAVAELQSGLKRTHWMWFIFPQLDGLAVSQTARKYSIKSLEEGRGFLEHPILGPRLTRCAEALLGVDQKSANDIFSYPDDVKLRSSMTLFSLLAGKESVFQSVLNKYFGGIHDNKTIEIFNRLTATAAPGINTEPDTAAYTAFKVFADRVTKEGKTRCGDSFAVEMLDDDGVLLLVVADGVSSCPCDWKASEVACEAVIKKFKECKGSVSDRMVRAAEKANNSVRQIGGACAGSITSLTFAVWDVRKDQIHFLNVGDSRIYLGPEDNLEQITHDDVAPVLLKRNGEVVLNAGVPVFMRGVTRSLGQTDPLEFEVQTRAFRNHEIVLLVSDGISKNEAFTTSLRSIFGAQNVEDKLSQFVRESSYANRDDATLIVIWRTGQSDSSFDEIKRCIFERIDFRGSNLSRGQILNLIKTELPVMLMGHFDSEVHATLDYAKDFGLNFDREFLSELLSIAIKYEDRVIVERLRNLIRKSV